MIPDIALMATVLAMIWLGIVAFAQWLYWWQTLAAALVALLAAALAFHNTNRTLRQAAEQETVRLERKHAAQRAVLPIGLAQVLDYAQSSARALDQLAIQCEHTHLQQLTRNTAPQALIQRRPPETLKALADFIEYSDTLNVVVLEDTVGWMQIHNSRVRRLVERNRDPTQIVVRTEIMGSVDLRQLVSLPTGVPHHGSGARVKHRRIDVSWQEVRAALLNIGVVTDQYEAIVTRRERQVRTGCWASMIERTCGYSERSCDRDRAHGRSPRPSVPVDEDQES